MKKLLPFFVALFIILSSNNLISGTYSGGSGLYSDPYLLSAAADINELMSSPGDWHKFFSVTQDINCYGFSWSGSNPSQIGNNTTRFTGVFEGNGFEINSISINKPLATYVGFFGEVDGANIKNLGLVNIQVVGYRSVGCFVGLVHSGKITNCYCRGTSSATSDISYAGGFCGRMF